MNLETLFEKFELFTESPEAVGKLRKMILHMAVQGPLLKAGTCKHELLGSLISLQKGKKPTNLTTQAVGLPYLDIAALEKSEFRQFSKDQKCPQADNGDLVIVCDGSRSGLVLNGVPGILGSTVAKILHSGFEPRYLKYLLDSYYNDLNTAKKGAAIPHLDIKRLLNKLISLPPLAEQKRIVAKVDELMALCDRLEAQLQDRDTRHADLARASLARFADAPTPANLDFLFHHSYAIPPADLRKSILTLAVQGKLVPQDPNEEPAEKLYMRIQTKRKAHEASGAYKTVKELPPIKVSDMSFELPATWKWARLRSLVYTLGDGLHGTPQYSEAADYYFINGNNLSEGQIIIRPHTKTIALEEAHKHRKPMTLSTVLVSINGTLGNVAFYNNENVILGKSACYFNLSSLTDKQFIRRVIESPYFVCYADANATGTTIRNLGLKAMNYFPIPLPPLAEQKRIVAKVDELMALVDSLETQLAESRTTASRLLDAIVHQLASP